MTYEELSKGIQGIDGIIKEAQRNPERAKILLHNLLHVDESTGVLSKRGLEKFLDESSTKSTQSGILYVDLMDLKKINDAQGHYAGDQAILTVSTTLRQLIRSKDTRNREQDSLFRRHEVGRVGGDEFVAVLKDISGYSGLVSASTRIRDYFNNNSLPPIAMGGALHIPNQDIAEVVQLADAAMYKIKRAIYSRDKDNLVSDFSIHYR